MTEQVLCRLDEIGESEARAFGPFDGSRTKAFVVRKDGRLYAWWDSCPHQDGSPMAWRTNAYLNARAIASYARRMERSSRSKRVAACLARLSVASLLRRQSKQRLTAT